MRRAPGPSVAPEGLRRPRPPSWRGTPGQPPASGIEPGLDDMGRTFENRKIAILKRSDRDAKAFSRCGRQIAMAVKAGGPDPDVNPQLRRVLQNARAVNMPKDKVQGAIDRASGAGESADFEEIVYEGYGPHGVPMMVVTATDNPTRTVANVRLAFNKCGGNLGSS